MINEMKIEFADLKDLYLDACDGRSICNFSENNAHVRSLVENWVSPTSFYGSSSSQMRKYLRFGYHQPGLTLEPPIEPVRKRRRINFAEEGELQIDLAYSGHDYPFLAWDFREVMPGMKVMIHMDFQAGTRIEVINEYNRWVLRALVALEEAGLDLEVDVHVDSAGLFAGNSDVFSGYIRVKKEGEQTDLLSWSPILAPGSFRHLVFLYLIWGADQLKHNATMGLGRGLNTGAKWNVSYDSDERELKFMCPWSPRSFPEEEMDLELKDILSQVRRAA